MNAQAWTTLVIGLVGFGGVILTMRQRDRADRQNTWWNRATWAFEQTLRPEPSAQATGFGLLDTLSESKLVPGQDRDFLVAITTHRLARALGVDLREHHEEADNNGIPEEERP